MRERGRREYEEDQRKAPQSCGRFSDRNRWGLMMVRDPKPNMTFKTYRVSFKAEGSPFYAIKALQSLVQSPLFSEGRIRAVVLTPLKGYIGDCLGDYYWGY